MSRFPLTPKVLAAPLMVGALAAIGIVGAVAAFGNDDADVRSPGGDDDPVVGEPGAPGEQEVDYSVIHKVRLDLAERLAIDPRDITLRDITYAGWDGCLGVYVEDEACTMIFIGGAIVMLEADGERYRYHIGGDEFVATDFVDGEVVDGMPLDPEMIPDTNAWLAAYGRGDLALRLGVDIDAIAIDTIAPITFPNLCLGFMAEPDQACAEALAPGAIVMLSQGGEAYRYHVSLHGIVAVSFEDGETTVEADPAVAAVQQKMRKHLANELGVDQDKVSVLSYRDVQWPDGCLGVYFKDALCSQAIVDGFVAVLGVAGSDTGYTHHGAGEEFTGIASLDPDEFRLGYPLPAETE